MHGSQMDINNYLRITINSQSKAELGEEVCF